MWCCSNAIQGQVGLEVQNSSAAASAGNPFWPSKHPYNSWIIMFYEAHDPGDLPSVLEQRR